MRKKVLIIEGDETWARMMAGALEKEGSEVEIVYDGMEGLGKAQREHPDFIILSVELPRESGYLICKKLKEDKELRKIPLMLISAEATEEDFERHRKLRVRADDYLRKPFTDEEFLAKVSNHIGFGISQQDYEDLQEKIHQFLLEKESLEKELEEKKERIAELEALLEEEREKRRSLKALLENALSLIREE